MSRRTFAQRTKSTAISASRRAFQSRPFALPPAIQAKLTVGQPNDKYEQEADQVADQVVGSLQRMENPQEEVQMKPLANNMLQKQEGSEEEDEEVMMKPDLQKNISSEEEDDLQLKSEGAEEATTSDSIESTISQARGSGSALPDIFRSKVEQAIGADFSGVRIHTDQTSDTLSRSLSAKAFTTGSDIFFKQGEYNPNSAEGQKLLTHELTHTVQQNPNLVQRKSDQSTLLSPSTVMDSGTVQLKGGGGKKKGSGFVAGQPSAWHVHYDHIKYGSNQSTRVNFGGRSSAKVIEKLNEILEEQPGLREKAGLQECIDWINDYV